MPLIVSQATFDCQLAKLHPRASMDSLEAMQPVWQVYLTSHSLCSGSARVSDGEGINWPPIA